jgi:hypothetical protein
MISRGKADARKLAHAPVLLQADEAEGGPGWADEMIARRCGSACARSSGCGSGSWSKDWRRRYCPSRPRGSTDASWTGNRAWSAAPRHLLALACARPPEGKARWSLRPLAERMPTPGLAP